MIFDTHNLILEGPDLSGKTTVYNLLHSKTSYAKNIQDRSCLSMLCYAILYNRDVPKWRKNFFRELSNLNNRVVILLPSFVTLAQRYQKRGDEIQDLQSLKKLYRIFHEEAESVKSLPTVKVITENCSPDVMCDSILSWLDSVEDTNPQKVGDLIKDFVLFSDKDEHVLDIEVQSSLRDLSNSDIMSDPREGKYYTDILNDLQLKVQNEFDGINEYNVPQTSDSRRFYYNSDTCISSIHLLPRDYKVDVIATLRSTDVVRNASIDLDFLGYLQAYFAKHFFTSFDIGTLRVRFNSAHVRRDLD